MVNKLCPETTALIRLYKNETELSYKKLLRDVECLSQLLIKSATRNCIRSWCLRFQMVKLDDQDVLTKGMKDYYCELLRRYERRQ